MAVDLSTYGGTLLPAGFAGQPADANTITSVSLMSESTGAIDFGIAVARGATDSTCKLIAADTDLPVGITLRNPTRTAAADGTVTYARYDAVPIARTGFMFAIPFENVTRGDTAISITAQGGKLGGTTGGSAGAGRVALDGTGTKPEVVWETTTAAGAIGRVRILS